MTTPSLTIGMPVYNGERFLRQALDSLLAQTYRDFELFISDNASTDSTPDICREYGERDARIRYVRQPENRGVFPNTTYVVENARGEFFMLVGDDDIYEPDYAEKMIALLRRYPESDTAYSNYGYIDAAGAVSPSGLKVFLCGRESRERKFRRFLLVRIVLPMMMGVFRTAAFRRALPFVTFRDGMTGGVDIVFMMRFLTHSGVESSNEVLFYYRLKDRTAVLPSHWRTNRWKEQWSMLRLRWTILTKHTIPIIAAAPFSGMRKLSLSLFAVTVFLADHSVIPFVHATRKRRRTGSVAGGTAVDRRVAHVDDQDGVVIRGDESRSLPRVD